MIQFLWFAIAIAQSRYSVAVTNIGQPTFHRPLAVEGYLVQPTTLSNYTVGYAPVTVDVSPAGNFHVAFQCTCSSNYTAYSPVRCALLSYNASFDPASPLTNVQFALWWIEYDYPIVSIGLSSKSVFVLAPMEPDECSFELTVEAVNTAYTVVGNTSAPIAPPPTPFPVIPVPCDVARRVDQCCANASCALCGMQCPSRCSCELATACTSECIAVGYAAVPTPPTTPGPPTFMPTPRPTQPPFTTAPTLIATIATPAPSLRSTLQPTTTASIRTDSTALSSSSASLSTTSSAATSMTAGPSLASTASTHSILYTTLPSTSALPLSELSRATSSMSTSTSTPEASVNHRVMLSLGAIIGIAAGACVCCVLLLAVVVCSARRRGATRPVEDEVTPTRQLSTEMVPPHFTNANDDELTSARDNVPSLRADAPSLRENVPSLRQMSVNAAPNEYASTRSMLAPESIPESVYDVPAPRSEYQRVKPIVSMYISPDEPMEDASPQCGVVQSNYLFSR